MKTRRQEYRSSSDARAGLPGKRCVGRPSVDSFFVPENFAEITDVSFVDMEIRGGDEEVLRLMKSGMTWKSVADSWEAQRGTKCGRRGVANKL